jgi:hypothetical protein
VLHVFEVCYAGHFSYFYEHPRVVPYLQCLHDRDLLFDVENTRGSCADVFYESVPWPVRPEHHLVARTLRLISFEKSVSADPFNATTDAIEFASWGPWIGFTTLDVCKILSELESPHRSRGRRDQNPNLSVAGRRMMIPFFSHGFQGIVVGFFLGIDDAAAELIRTEILQFGQTLADKWSMLRHQHFSEALRRYQDVNQVIEALVQMVSPIDYIIVELRDQTSGYRLRREANYWAGYERLTRAELISLKNSDAEIRLENIILPNSNVVIKTLSGHSMFDAQFTRARLEIILNHPLADVQTDNLRQSITFDRLAAKLNLIKEKTALGSASHASYRQIYVLEKMMRDFNSGFATISNNELRLYFKDKFSGSIKNGYQISSHSEDIDKLFDGEVLLEKTRNGVTVRWKL